MWFVKIKYFNNQDERKLFDHLFLYDQYLQIFTPNSSFSVMGISPDQLQSLQHYVVMDMFIIN